MPPASETVPIGAPPTEIAPPNPEGHDVPAPKENALSTEIGRSAAYEGAEAKVLHPSMVFEIVEERPWDAQSIRGYLQALGAKHSRVTDKDAEALMECYGAAPSNRHYHGEAHGAYMGQPWIPDDVSRRLSAYTTHDEMKARVAFAGLTHDMAYKHVDELDADGTRAWPTVLKEQIADTADYSRTVENDKVVYRTYLTEKGKADPTAQMVARIFGVTDEGIIHNQGGNEFDSALAAAKFLAARNVPFESQIAVTAMTAATIPFRTAMTIGEDGRIINDGHMGELAKVVHDELVANRIASPEAAWAQTNDIMLGAVHIANRDIAAIITPNNFAEVVHNGRAVKAEEIPELRHTPTTIAELTRAAGIQKSAPLLYGSIAAETGGFVPAENVPHVYVTRNAQGVMQDPETAAYPPLPAYRDMVTNARENTAQAHNYFVAHEVGTVAVAAIATSLDEPHAPVPGFVRAAKWHPQAVISEERLATLSPADRALYEELRFGRGQQQIDSATPPQSPTAGILVGALGSAGVARLSEYIQEIRAAAAAQGNADPFTDRHTAQVIVRELWRKVGNDTMRIITTELHRAARHYQDDPERGDPDRALWLQTLCGGINEYD